MSPVKVWCAIVKEKILAMLKENDGYLSGMEISRKLGVSRTAIWKNINSLRSDGYQIDSITNRGYQLISSPDILNAAMIQDHLGTELIGKEIEILKTVDSTNEEVKRRANLGAESGLIVAAEEQTAGKGRFGRSWNSQDKEAIYFTVLIRPELSPGDIASITLAAGYAVCLAVREYTQLDARIKWPNDIIIGHRKLCGILTEMAAQSDKIDYIAIGIGININQKSFPEEIKTKATSLYLETGHKIDRNDFFRIVIRKLDMVLKSFCVSVSVKDIENFKRLCATIGRKVSVQRFDSILEGTAIDITPSGELVIKANDGKKYDINSGEVTVQGIY